MLTLCPFSNCKKSSRDDIKSIITTMYKLIYFVSTVIIKYLYNQEICLMHFTSAIMVKVIDGPCRVLIVMLIQL